jgi:hypothetical protein
MLNDVLALAWLALGRETDRSLEAVFLFCLLGLTLSLAVSRMTSGL